MSVQKRSSTNPRVDEEIVEAAGATTSAKSTNVDLEVDAMLEEIDTVLEQNAEEFVKSFIQKGGQ